MLALNRSGIVVRPKPPFSGLASCHRPDECHPDTGGPQSGTHDLFGS